MTKFAHLPCRPSPAHGVEIWRIKVLRPPELSDAGQVDRPLHLGEVDCLGHRERFEVFQGVFLKLQLASAGPKVFRQIHLFSSFEEIIFCIFQGFTCLILFAVYFIICSKECNERRLRENHHLGIGLTPDSFKDLAKSL